VLLDDFACRLLEQGSMARRLDFEQRRNLADRLLDLRGRYIRGKLITADIWKVLIAAPVSVDMFQHLDPEMGEIREHDPLRSEAVPEKRLIGIGPFLHDTDDARRIVTEHLESFLALVEFGATCIEWEGRIDDDDQSTLGGTLRDFLQKQGCEGLGAQVIEESAVADMEGGRAGGPMVGHPPHDGSGG